MYRPAPVELYLQTASPGRAALTRWRAHDASPSGARLPTPVEPSTAPGSSYRAVARRAVPGVPTPPRGPQPGELPAAIAGLRSPTRRNQPGDKRRPGQDELPKTASTPGNQHSLPSLGFERPEQPQRAWQPQNVPALPLARVKEDPQSPSLPSTARDSQESPRQGFTKGGTFAQTIPVGGIALTATVVAPSGYVEDFDMFAGPGNDAGPYPYAAPLRIRDDEVYRTRFERHMSLRSGPTSPREALSGVGGSRLPRRLPASSRKFGAPPASPAQDSSCGLDLPRVRSSFSFGDEDGDASGTDADNTLSPNSAVGSQVPFSREVTVLMDESVIGGSKGDRRDWNAEFQNLLESSALTPEEEAVRADRLRKFVEDFRVAIMPLAMTIIEERHLPDSRKTIPPAKKADAGGVAGGDKYIQDGFFFKFTNTDANMRLYGSYHNAMKSASHERKGVCALSACGVPRLRVPLTLVVTHLGQRLWVSTLVPVDGRSRPPVPRAGMQVLVSPPGELQKTPGKVVTAPSEKGGEFFVDFEGRGKMLVTAEWWTQEASRSCRPCGCPVSLRYGCSNAAYVSSSGHVHSDAIVHDLCTKAAAVMNLKPHYVGARDHGDLVLVAGPIDMEVHQCSQDGRFYVLDAARLFPPEPPCEGSSHLFRLLRPELVRRNRTPLSSDACSAFGHDHRKEHDNEVREAALTLHKEVIPRCAARVAHQLLLRSGRLEGGGARSVHPALSPPLPVTAVLHSHGINMRHVGRVVTSFLRYSVRNPLASGENRRIATSALIAEMCARAFKGIMWQQHAALPALPLESHAKAAAEGFERLLHGGQLSGLFWQRELLPRLRNAFGCEDATHEQLVSEIPFLGGTARRVGERGGAHQEEGSDMLLTQGFFYHIYVRACDLLGARWSICDRQLLQLGTGYGERTFTAEVLIGLEPVVKLNDVPPLAVAAGLERQGCVEDAARLYQDEIAARTLVSGGDTVSVVPLLNSLAALFELPQWQKPKRHQVLGLRKRVVKIYQDLRLGEGCEDRCAVEYADALNALGAELEFSGAFDEALKAYGTAAQAREPVEGTLGFGAADGCRHAARVLAAMGCPRKAVASGERAVAILERLHSRKECSKEAATALAHSYDSVAGQYGSLGQWARADHAAKKGLALRRRVLPEGHPDIAVSQLQRAKILEAQGDLCSALQQVKAAGQVLEKALSPDDARTALALCHEARLLRKTALFGEGLKLVQEGWGRLKRIRGDASVEAATAGCHYARFLVDPHAGQICEGPECQNTLKAADLFETGCRSLADHHGHSRLPQMVHWSTWAGRCLLLLERDDEAERRLGEAVSAADSLELDDHHARAALVALGRLRCRQQRHGEACQLYYRALAKAERAEGRLHCEHAAISALETCKRLHQGQQVTSAIAVPRKARVARLTSIAATSAFLVHYGRSAEAADALRTAVRQFSNVFPPDAPPDALSACPLMVIEGATNRLLSGAGLAHRDAVNRICGPGGDVEQLMAVERMKSEAEQERQRDAQSRQAAEEKAEEKGRVLRRLDATLRQLLVFVGRAKYTAALPLLLEAVETPDLELPEAAQLRAGLLDAAAQLMLHITGDSGATKRVQEAHSKLRAMGNSTPLARSLSPEGSDSRRVSTQSNASGGRRVSLSPTSGERRRRSTLRAIELKPPAEAPSRRHGRRERRDRDARRPSAGRRAPRGSITEIRRDAEDKERRKRRHKQQPQPDGTGALGELLGAATGPSPRGLQTFT
eukprot:TRINITY_DN6733_c0_g1_i1.p1 TRINITY_DN6733_c0_g1~~TRINITY_DN6733_c0_g1_i1.p1  ORF type:complete len:1742 (+),score=470.97 TRINITY_DN6733_c0_g1_i1:80-5305(+)